MEDNQEFKKRFELLEENISLGSFDSIFLALNVFLAGLIISLSQSSKYLEGIKYEPVFVIRLYAVVLAIQIVMLIITYFMILFSDKKKQFLIRIGLTKLYVFFLLSYFWVIILGLLLFHLENLLQFFDYKGLLRVFVLVMLFVPTLLLFILSKVRWGFIHNFVEGHFKKRCPLLFEKYNKPKQNGNLLDWLHNLTKKMTNLFYHNDPTGIYKKEFEKNVKLMLQSSVFLVLVVDIFVRFAQEQQILTSIEIILNSTIYPAIYLVIYFVYYLIKDLVNQKRNYFRFFNWLVMVNFLMLGLYTCVLISNILWYSFGLGSIAKYLIYISLWTLIGTSTIIFFWLVCSLFKILLSGIFKRT